ncbi:MAG: hypothetical protein ACFCVB_06955, partial [Nodosilinea sp.]
PPAQSPPQPSTPPQPGWPGHPTELLIGALVPPVLLGILASRVLADGLTQMGLASEQLFAGERLPHLNLATPPVETSMATDEG